MGRIFIYPGMKLTPEEIAELDELDNIPDEEIDYSDAPKLTEEQLNGMVRVCDLYPDGKVTDLHPERRLLELYNQRKVAN